MAEIDVVREKVEAAKRSASQATQASEALLAEMREANADLLSDENYTKIKDAEDLRLAKVREYEELRGRQVTILEAMGTKEAAQDLAPREATALGHIRSRLANNLINSAAYKAASAHVNFDRKNLHFSMDAAELAKASEVGQMLRNATVITVGSSSAGDTLVPFHDPEIYDLWRATPSFLDLISFIPTKESTVEWSFLSARTSNAAQVAYGSAAAEGVYVWDKASLTMKRTTLNATATTQILGEQSRLQDFLNNDLLTSAKLVVETQALSGDNTGENYKGISEYSTSDIDSASFPTFTRIDLVRESIKTIRVNTFGRANPRYLVIHPNDLHQLRLAKDANGLYIWPDSQATLWGLTPIESFAVAENAPLVMDPSWSKLYVQHGFSVAASTEHSDNFTKGLVTFDGEFTGLFALQQEKSVGFITNF